MDSQLSKNMSTNNTTEILEYDIDISKLQYLSAMVSKMNASMRLALHAPTREYTPENSENVSEQIVNVVTYFNDTLELYGFYHSLTVGDSSKVQKTDFSNIKKFNEVYSKIEKFEGHMRRSKLIFGKDKLEKYEYI